MPKKLTISISDDVYEGLYTKVGARRIGRFLEDLARPLVVPTPKHFSGSLADAYRKMAAEDNREMDAAEWIDSNPGETLPDEDSVTGPTVRRGEVWWVAFGAATGGEIRKSRRRGFEPTLQPSAEPVANRPADEPNREGLSERGLGARRRQNQQGGSRPDHHCGPRTLPIASRLGIQ